MKNYLVVNKVASKYGNIKTEYQGRKYDSKKEAEYAMQLDFMRKAVNPKDKVIDWEPQVPFQVELNGKKICKYFADFKVTYADGRVEIVDVKPIDRRTGKSRSTDVFKIKKKLVEAQYSVEILEV